MTRAFRSEVVKMRRPAMLLGPLAMVAFAVLGTTLGISRADRGTGELTVARLSQSDGFALMLQRTVDFLGIVALGVVAIAVAQEYSHGTLRNLLVFEPRRLRLLAGKVAANLLYVAVMTSVAAGVVLTVALLFAPSKGIDTDGWLHDGLGTSLAGIGDLVLAVLGFGLLGAILAVVLRSPAPAVIAGVAWTGPLENLLTAAWQSVGHWLPGQQLAAIADHGNSVSSYGWALGLGSVFGVVAVVAGAGLFQRRDVAA